MEKENETKAPKTPKAKTPKAKGRGKGKAKAKEAGKRGIARFFAPQITSKDGRLNVTDAMREKFISEIMERRGIGRREAELSLIDSAIKRLSATRRHNKA